MISHVNLMITNKCNSDCKYCYVDAKKTNESKELELPRIFDFLDKFKKYGGHSIMLTGGEALLYPEIEKVMERGKELELRVILFTNGIALNKDRFNEISKFVDFFSISLDGPEEIHNLNRGISNAYQSVIQVLELFKENNVSYSIQMTIDKNNLEYIDFVGEVAQKYNAKSVRLVHMLNHGRGESCNDFLNEAEFLQIKERAVELSRKYKYRPYFGTNLYTEKEIETYFKSDVFIPTYWIDHQGDLCLFSTNYKENFKLCNIDQYPEGIREDVWKNGLKMTELLNSRLRGQKACHHEKELLYVMDNFF